MRLIALLAFACLTGAPHAQDKLPLIKIVATGGTIANTPSGRLHAGEVAEAIPQLKKVARLEVEEVMRVGSSAITLEQWLTLARRINEIFAREPEVKGVVVTDNNAVLDSFLDDSDNPVTGILEYSGSVGSFFITVTTVMSKPVIGGITSFADYFVSGQAGVYGVAELSGAADTFSGQQREHSEWILLP